jgi:serine/threonine protein kinase
MTLFEKHFSQLSNSLPIQEQLLWSYMIQILSLMKTIHLSGMAIRLLDPSNIILTNHYR